LKLLFAFYRSVPERAEIAQSILQTISALTQRPPFLCGEENFKLYHYRKQGSLITVLYAQCCPVEYSTPGTFIFHEQAKALLL
jgi:hypothetical protein